MLRYVDVDVAKRAILLLQSAHECAEHAHTRCRLTDDDIDVNMTLSVTAWRDECAAKQVDKENARERKSGGAARRSEVAEALARRTVLQRRRSARLQAGAKGAQRALLAYLGVIERMERQRAMLPIRLIARLRFTSRHISATIAE